MHEFKVHFRSSVSTPVKKDLCEAIQYFSFAFYLPPPNRKRGSQDEHPNGDLGKSERTNKLTTFQYSSF